MVLGLGLGVQGNRPEALQGSDVEAVPAHRRVAEEEEEASQGILFFDRSGVLLAGGGLEGLEKFRGFGVWFQVFLFRGGWQSLGCTGST